MRDKNKIPLSRRTRTTGGTQKTDDDDPELPGAEELQPRQSERAQL